jgi:hypothetical protein
MIELLNDSLVFHFPDVHGHARLSLSLQRTLRIPDDDRDYPLPPGLDRFPLVHVDDYAERVPEDWRRHGGVMLPMYQSEALWIDLNSRAIPRRNGAYPFAVRIATGKIDALTGAGWDSPSGLKRKPQNYIVAPDQPWLDGYAVDRGFIRQFVAMPLGAGYTAEEQLTGSPEFGGLQVQVFPMKRASFDRLYPVVPPRRRHSSLGAPGTLCCAPPTDAMGLAPGGRMRQSIEEDPYDFTDWDEEHSSRCFIHIANSMTWRAITDKEPPTPPLTAREYERSGMPWFDHYAERPLGASQALADLKSVATLSTERGDRPLADNTPVEVSDVVFVSKGISPV